MCLCNLYGDYAISSACEPCRRIDNGLCDSSRGDNLLRYRSGSTGRTVDAVATHARSVHLTARGRIPALGSRLAIHVSFDRPPRRHRSVRIERQLHSTVHHRLCCSGSVIDRLADRRHSDRTHAASGERRPRSGGRTRNSSVAHRPPSVVPGHAELRASSVS